MIPVSDKFKQALANDYRAYITYADFTLANGYQLTVSGDQIWANGLVINDAVSSDTQLEVGSAIINSAQLVINNMYDEFTQYTFEGATCEIYVGLRYEDDTEERVKKGVFNVDTCDYTSDLITINLLDNMSKFDVSYELSALTPTWNAGSNRYTSPNLYQIINEACTTCGVTLATTSFTNESFVPQEYANIDKSQYTYRDMISFAAQCAGLNATVNNDGELELKWYDTGSLAGTEYSVNGGYFQSDLPFSEGAGTIAAVGATTSLWANWIIANGTRYNGVTYTISTGSQISFHYTPHTASDPFIGIFYQTGNLIAITDASYGYGEYSGGKFIKFQISGQLGADNPFSLQVYFLEKGNMVLYFDKVPSKPPEDTGQYAAALGNGLIKWDDLEAGVPYVSIYYGNTWVVRKGREYVLSGIDLDSSSNDGFPINQRNGMVKVSDLYIGTNPNQDKEPRYIAHYSTAIHSNITAYANRFSNYFGLHANINTQVYFELAASLANYTYLYTTAFYFQKGTCKQYGEFLKYRYEGVVVADADAATFNYYALTEEEKRKKAAIIELYYLSDGTELYVVPIQMPETGELTVTARTAPYATSTTQTVSGISYSNMDCKKVTANNVAAVTLTTGNADGGQYGGGYTNPFTGTHVIDECYSTRFAKDDITVTGVRVVVNRQVEVDGSTEERTVVFTTGTSDYMIQIEDNPLIPTASDAEAQFIADILGARLIGMRFRTTQLTHSSDPTIEGGDVALAIDRKGRVHPILVTSTTFSSSAAQSTQCSAESVSDNRANRKSASTGLYDKVIDTVNKLIAANKGETLADYVVAKGTSGNWYYQHWNSGRKEAWFNGSVSSGSTWTASGNAYRATWSQSIPSAVGFGSTPHVLISIAQNTTAIYAMTGHATSKTATSGYFFRGNSASSSSSVTISIYAWTN